MMYFVYLIRSIIDREIYLGSTNDLRQRISEHNGGKVISTNRYKPWELIYYEAYKNENDAKNREHNLKYHGKGMHELKKRLINSLLLPNLKSVKIGAGFTLVEILIAVSIIAILATILLATNVQSTYQKGRDSKRKTDLNKMARILEDYYNDHQRYPEEALTPGVIKDAAWGEPFSPYLPILPADPLSSNRDYYYMTDPNAQNFYALYAKLELTADQDIERTGCDDGCGPDRAYNYVVHSPNIVMYAGLPSSEAELGGGGGGGGGRGGGG